MSYNLKNNFILDNGIYIGWRNSVGNTVGVFKTDTIGNVFFNSLGNDLYINHLSGGNVNNIFINGFVSMSNLILSNSTISNFYSTNNTLNNLSTTLKTNLGSGYQITGSAGTTNFLSTLTTNFINATLNVTTPVNNSGNTIDTPYPILNMFKPGIASQSYDNAATFYINRFTTGSLNSNSELQLGLSNTTVANGSDSNTITWKYRSDGTSFALGTVDSTNTSNGTLVVNGGVAIQKNLNIGGTLNINTISVGNIWITSITSPNFSSTNIVATNLSSGTILTNLATIGNSITSTTANLFVNGILASNGVKSNQAGSLSSFSGGDIGFYYVGTGTLQFVNNAANTASINSAGTFLSINVNTGNKLNTFGVNYQGVGYSSSQTTNYLNSTLNLNTAVNNSGSTADTPYPVLNLVKGGVSGFSYDSVATFYLNRFSNTSGNSAFSELQLGLANGSQSNGTDNNTITWKYRSDGTTFALGTVDSTNSSTGTLIVSGGVGVQLNLNVANTINTNTISVSNLFSTNSSIQNLNVANTINAIAISVGNLFSTNSSIKNLNVSNTINTIALSVGNLFATNSTIQNLNVANAINTNALSVGNLLATSSTMVNLNIIGNITSNSGANFISCAGSLNLTNNTLSNINLGKSNSKILTNSADLIVNGDSSFAGAVDSFTENTSLFNNVAAASTLTNHVNFVQGYYGKNILYTSAGNAFISSNYGNSFSTITITTTASVNLSLNAVNYNFQYLLSTDTVNTAATLFRSNSSGNAWVAAGYTTNGSTSAYLSGSALPGSNFSSLCISGNGQYQLAAVNIRVNGSFPTFITSFTSGMTLSSNYGATFSLITVTSGNIVSNTLGSFVSCAADYTGQNLITILGYGGGVTAEFVYVSNNFGTSWSQTDLGNPNSLVWVDVSGSGQYMVALSYASHTFAGLYLSSNFGASWSFVTSLPGNASNVYISYSGQYIIVPLVSGSVGFYYSSDYGVTFTQNNSLIANFGYAHLSKNGRNLLCLDSSNNGYIITHALNTSLIDFGAGISGNSRAANAGQISYNGTNLNIYGAGTSTRTVNILDNLNTGTISATNSVISNSVITNLSSGTISATNSTITNGVFTNLSSAISILTNISSAAITVTPTIANAGGYNISASGGSAILYYINTAGTFVTNSAAGDYTLRVYNPTTKPALRLGTTNSGNDPSSLDILSSGNVAINPTTDSTGATSGSIFTFGGMGITKSLKIGNKLNTFGVNYQNVGYNSTQSTNYINATLNLNTSVNNSGSTADTPYPVLNLIKGGVSGQSYDSVATFYLNRFSNSGTNAYSELQLGLANGNQVNGSDTNTITWKYRSDGTNYALGTVDSTNTSTGTLVVNGGVAIQKILNIGGNVNIAGDLHANGHTISSYPTHLSLTGTPAMYTSNSSTVTTAPATTSTYYYLLFPTARDASYAPQTYLSTTNLQVLYTGIYYVQLTLAGGSGTFQIEPFISYNPSAPGTAAASNDLNGPYLIAATIQTNSCQTSLSGTVALNAQNTVVPGFYLGSGSFSPNSRCVFDITLIQRTA